MSTANSPVSLVDDLLAFVRNEGYEPGDRLPPIRKLSRVLGAGRNVVRDGLLEAQTLGLVKIEPRQGVFVQETGAGQVSNQVSRVLQRALESEEQNLFHLIDARVMVETQLAAEAARLRRPEDLLPLRQALDGVLAAGDERLKYIAADERFHLTIARVAGNRVLLTFLEVLWNLIRPAKSSLLLSPQDRRVSDREHRELFQAIVASDPQRARTQMAQHLEQGRALLVDYACSPLPGGPTTSASSGQRRSTSSRSTRTPRRGGKK